MKRYPFFITLVGILIMSGCTKMEPITDSNFQNGISDATVFVRGMGCNDPNCTDSTHHHDCPSDCDDYNHYHNCDLNCTETSHHHFNTHHGDDIDTNVSFVSGMGCNDPNCTDSTHYHDCPADCDDYDHYHHCSLNCTETSHHHNESNNANRSGQHHQRRHHGGTHH